MDMRSLYAGGEAHFEAIAIRQAVAHPGAVFEEQGINLPRQVVDVNVAWILLAVRGPKEDPT